MTTRGKRRDARLPVRMSVAAVGMALTLSAVAGDVRVYDPDSGRLLPLESQRPDPGWRHDRQHVPDRHWQRDREVIVRPEIHLRGMAPAPSTEARPDVPDGNRVCRDDEGTTTWSTRPMPCD
ncbi:hypothetical protein [Chromohalobacter israelensis]|uniref:hypothetical protein n=1 Tax=Chromohalobacter israelensis TaxID=141390 RepID=UPI0012EC465E|nr:hypothetical protein [Chromohalobacter israelensis]MDF9435874.1 hypothetical protein [Chromohalobacter israelensis]